MVRSSAGAKRKHPGFWTSGIYMLSLIVLLSQPVTPWQESGNSSVLSGWWSWVRWLVPTNAIRNALPVFSPCDAQKACGHFPACGFNESFESLVLFTPIQSWLPDPYILGWEAYSCWKPNYGTVARTHNLGRFCFTSYLDVAAVLKG